MLDTKKVGIKIASLRKKSAYSQENLAEMLGISSTAISKWENGHTLPETQTLPLLAQIFGCTIDDIIMPAYLLDEKIEIKKSDTLEQQAEHIANYVIKKMEDKDIGLNEKEIINAVKNVHPDAIIYEIIRSKPEKRRGYSLIYITVKLQYVPGTATVELKLAEKIFEHFIDSNEASSYVLFGSHVIPAVPAAVPEIYFVNTDRKILLTEDLSENYICGNNYDEDNESGEIIRENYNGILKAAAEFHAAFWGKRFGLPWHFEAKENMLAWIHNAMEKPFKRYREDEESGKIPKSGIGGNNITAAQLDYFEQALQYIKSEYIKILESRYNTGKNITRIHGDLHPGNTFISKSAGRTVKFIDMQAMRTGLCTEDLAMLIALHIASDTAASALDNHALKEYIQAIKKSDVMPLLDSYYNCLSETVKDYSYETFMSDYKLSVAENMFFTIRLINDGIFDFKMRDKAIRAYELFVLGAE